MFKSPSPRPCPRARRSANRGTPRSGRLERRRGPTYNGLAAPETGRPRMSKESAGKHGIRRIGVSTGGGERPG